MKRVTPAGYARRLAMAVARRVPAPLLQRWFHLWVPLARYGGKSRAGARALSRALHVLIEEHPPPPPEALLSLDGMAARAGVPEGDIERWAARGLLEQPVEVGPPPLWGRKGLERARLVAYLRRIGVTEDEMARAAATGHLPMLVVEHVLAPGGTLTVSQVSDRAGVPVEFTERLWRAVGMPQGDPDDRLYTRQDLEALRLVGVLRAFYRDDDFIIDTAKVIGRAMRQIASAQVEAFLGQVGPRLAQAGSGELEMALRAAAAADIIHGPAMVMLEGAQRHHLEAVMRSETLARVEDVAHGLPGQIEAAIGFADLVGFTAISEQLNPVQLAEIAARLVSLADEVLPEHGVGVVKTIGDAVMFAGADAASGCSAALALVDAVAGESGMPPLRVGIAAGPVLRRRADYFGRTVNVASRLCAVAPDQSVLLLCSGAVDESVLQSRGLRAGERLELRLRGVDGPVSALRVERGS